MNKQELIFEINEFVHEYELVEEKFTANRWIQVQNNQSNLMEEGYCFFSIYLNEEGVALLNYVEGIWHKGLQRSIITTFKESSDLKAFFNGKSRA